MQGGRRLDEMHRAIAGCSRSFGTRTSGSIVILSFPPLPSQTAFLPGLTSQMPGSYGGKPVPSTQL